MRHLLLVGLVLFFALPGSASALTMLDPGGSAVNPIYVQDVTPHQLQQPQQTGMSYQDYLRKMNPGVTQQVQPTHAPVQAPSVIYISTPPSPPAIQQTVPNNPGTNIGVDGPGSCDRMVMGQLIHLGFLSSEDCYIQWQAAIEAKQEEYAAPSQPTVIKAATQTTTTKATDMTTPTTTVPSVQSQTKSALQLLEESRASQEKVGWWARFLNWLGL